jgi:outer membrane protein assembly factor BamB
MQRRQLQWGVLALLVCVSASATRADDWPQWLGPKRDGVWRETGILAKFPEGGPKVRWRTPVGLGYAGPAVAAGKVFVTDFLPGDGVRMPASGFNQRGVIKGKERVLCLDEATGTPLWTHAYDCTYKIDYPAGPRCTPIVDGDRVYTLGAMGNLFCLDVATGKPLWSKDFVADFEGNASAWGFSAHPLLDGDKLICLTGARNALVTAFDKKTGKESWKALSGPEPGYAPPTVGTFGGTRQLIIWHPLSVNGLDPETGKVFWTERFPLQAGLSVSTPRQDGDRLFLTAFYNGPMMLDVTGGDAPAAKVAWKGRSNSELPGRTDGLHSIMSTPFLKDGHIYGVCSHGELRCLDAATGKRVWETFAATTGKGTERWANAFLIFQKEGDDERCFIPNDQGDLIVSRLTPKGYE